MTRAPAGRFVIAAALALVGAAPAFGQTVPGPDAAADLSLMRELRGQVMPQTITTLSSEMAGRIRELPVKDGERVREGQLLVRFDCAVQESQLARARATLEKKRRVQEANAKLGQLGSVSMLEREVAGAEVAEAQAEARHAQALVERCVINAPFPGRVSGVAARPHQFVGEGQPLVELVDERRFELELLVPSRWLAWLGPGYPFLVEIDENGRRYKAEVDRLAGRADPVSRSIKVYGRFVGDSPGLLAGMSGRAVIDPPAAAPPNSPPKPVGQ